MSDVKPFQSRLRVRGFSVASLLGDCVGRGGGGGARGTVGIEDLGAFDEGSEKLDKSGDSKLST